jgi:hypothetical protein
VKYASKASLKTHPSNMVNIYRKNERTGLRYDQFKKVAINNEEKLESEGLPHLNVQLQMFSYCGYKPGSRVFKPHTIACS